MSELVLHETTARQLEQAITNQPQAIAFMGPTGIGKTAAAYYFISQLLQVPVEKLDNHPYGRLISPEKNSISIEVIRELTQFLKLKTLGAGIIRRFVVIEHAETMTREAQNTLLKTLEEPPADSVIILTIEHEQVMLPTIMSRLQTIPIHLPAEAQLHDFFGKMSNPDQFEQLYRLSGGLPGLLHALAEQEQDHPLYEAVNQAKQILQSSVFGRLAQVDSLSKQKAEIPALLEILTRMADTAIKQAAVNRNTSALHRWQKILTASYNSQKLIQQGAQAKLALTSLMLEL